jgi:predicted neutral ceramidase superfamily lipid hydrolase
MEIELSIEYLFVAVNMAFTCWIIQVCVDIAIGITYYYNNGINGIILTWIFIFNKLFPDNKIPTNGFLIILIEIIFLAISWVGYFILIVIWPITASLIILIPFVIICRQMKIKKQGESKKNGEWHSV